MTTKDTTQPIVSPETALPNSSAKDNSVKIGDLSLHADDASTQQQNDQETLRLNKAEALPHANKDEDSRLNKEKTQQSDETKQQAKQQTEQQAKPDSEKDTSPPSKSCVFARIFAGASLLPYASILILSLLAFALSYFKPEIWLSQAEDLLILLENNTASLLAITAANGSMPIMEIISHSTNLIAVHDAAVRWPFTALLLQEVFLYSTLPPVLTYAALAISLCTAVLFATYMLARATGSSPKQGLAAICITLASPVYIAIYTVDISTLMLTVWILLAYTCFYRAWIQDRALSWLLAAFFFTALAGLSAGIGWILLPCITSILFLVWRCTFARASALDAVLAFTFFLIFFGAVIGIYALLPVGREILQTLLNTSVGSWQWAFATESQKEYALGLVLFSLPWLLIIPCTFIQCIQNLPKAFIQARTTNHGQGWLWWALCTGLISLALLNTPTLADMYVLWPLASILFAHALLGMQPRQARLFFKLCTGLFVLCALFFVYLAAVPSSSDMLASPLQQFTTPFFFIQAELTTMPLVLLACMLLLITYILAKEVDTRQAQGFLLALSIGFCIWIASALSLAPFAIAPEALQSLSFSSSEITEEITEEVAEEVEVEVDVANPTRLVPDAEALENSKPAEEPTEVSKDTPTAPETKPTPEADTATAPETDTENTRDLQQADPEKP